MPLYSQMSVTTAMLSKLTEVSVAREPQTQHYLCLLWLSLQKTAHFFLIVAQRSVRVVATSPGCPIMQELLSLGLLLKQLAGIKLFYIETESESFSLNLYIIFSNYYLLSLPIIKMTNTSS